MLFGRKSKDGGNGATSAPEKVANPFRRLCECRVQQGQLSIRGTGRRQRRHHRTTACRRGSTAARRYRETASRRLWGRRLPLMRLPEYKSYALADLEWFVLPPIMAGQFSVATAQSKTNGSTAPVGLVLWARVSPEVDRRLSGSPGQRIKLSPKEWTSGDILWIIAAAGDQRIVQGMLKHLQEKDWAKKPVKFVSRGRTENLPSPFSG